MHKLLWFCPTFQLLALGSVLGLPSLVGSPTFESLRVDKKPGQQTGTATVTMNGKLRQISRRAYQAWPVMEGSNALVLAAAHAGHRAANRYELIFIEGESRKRRTLGTVPFAGAELTQIKQADGTWAFLLTGRADGNQTLIAADLDAVHGRLENLNSVQMLGDQVKYRNASNPAGKTISVSALLATDLTGIYQPQSRTLHEGKAIQFLRNGQSIFLRDSGNVDTGCWLTDGQNMRVAFSDGGTVELPRTELTAITGVPAGARIVARLQRSLSSSSAKEGDAVTATLISPASEAGKIYLPQGTVLSGSLLNVHGVGWGIKHETAALSIAFRSAQLPDGRTLPVNTRLLKVENSQEKVDKDGTVQGIRSTGTLGHSAESKIASLAAVEPVAYLFATVSATATLGFAEPEILYPAGTELELEFTAPLVSSTVYPSAFPLLANSADEQQRLTQMVRSLPFRTKTKVSNKPSDLTNLAFIGSPGAIRRAFEAAGWVTSNQLTAESTFRTIKTLSGNQVYTQAPMSVLLLDERPPVFTLSKSTNTFSSRHHIRIFNPAISYENATVFTASSTQDIGIAFSQKQKTFIHVIDQHIDNERSKVLNDLEFTGCVDAAELVGRPWAPQDAYNSTGDKLRTDRAIAVLRINNCAHPRTSPSDNAVPPARFKRIVRDTMLTLRNDVWRGNVVYQGVSSTRWVKNYLATKDELKSDEGAWRKTDISGTEYSGIPGNSSDQRPIIVGPSEPEVDESARRVAEALENEHRWDPPRYEIGLEGGNLRYPSTKREQIAYVATPQDLTNPDPQIYAGAFGDYFSGGWTAGLSATLNTWKWISNRFTYTYQRGTYNSAEIFTNPVEEIEGRAGLVTRQFEYNLLVHARPPRSRWRPYGAIGPALVVTALSDAPVRKAAGPFKLGLQNVGLVLAAFQAGSTPPLDGGAVYAVGLVYGGGIKYRVRPRVTISADFRETWSRNPQFIPDSYTKSYLGEQGYHLDIDRSGSSTAKFRQQRLTLGVAFTF